MIGCFAFDIDGTLADGEHREHHIKREPGDHRPKEWDAYFEKCFGDAPIIHMIEVARCIGAQHPIVYVTGRVEDTRFDTERWLSRHFCPPGRIYMRPNGDHRNDDDLKIVLLEWLRDDGYDPIMVFDDRTRVVNAWRAAGVPCAQVAPGDF